MPNSATDSVKKVFIGLFADIRWDLLVGATKIRKKNQPWLFYYLFVN